jgi:DNA-binding MarR family transcriptional regulator
MTPPFSDSIDYLLAQVCRLHHARVHVLLEGIGIYRGQPPVLFMLWEQEGRTHSELAKHIHVQPATITKMIQRMERAGFVERRSDPDDERVSRVYLTDTGRAIQTEMQQIFEGLEQEALAGFSADERVSLRQLLSKIRDNLLRINDGSFYLKQGQPQ